MRHKYTLNCAHCGEPFHPFNRNAKYCGNACRGMSDRLPLDKQLWGNTDTGGGPDACWLFTGRILNTGYGRIAISMGDGKRVHFSAHRAAYELAYGPIPQGLLVCHRCDVRHCVNPAHLFLGTHADNMADAAQKGRMMHGERHNSRTRRDTFPRGERHGMAKLTETDVRAIRDARAAGETGRSIAHHYGVSEDTISLIVRRKRWLHVA